VILLYSFTSLASFETVDGEEEEEARPSEEME
jgi:hypothetical protein